LTLVVEVSPLRPDIGSPSLPRKHIDVWAFNPTILTSGGRAATNGLAVTSAKGKDDRQQR
jgi:hypothetical protein